MGGVYTSGEPVGDIYGKMSLVSDDIMKVIVGDMEMTDTIYWTRSSRIDVTNVREETFIPMVIPGNEFFSHRIVVYMSPRDHTYYIYDPSCEIRFLEYWVIRYMVMMVVSMVKRIHPIDHIRIQMWRSGYTPIPSQYPGIQNRTGDNYCVFWCLLFTHLFRVYGDVSMVERTICRNDDPIGTIESFIHWVYDHIYLPENMEDDVLAIMKEFVGDMQYRKETLNMRRCLIGVVENLYTMDDVITYIIQNDRIGDVFDLLLAHMGDMPIWDVVEKVRRDKSLRVKCIGEFLDIVGTKWYVDGDMKMFYTLFLYTPLVW